MRTLQNKSPLGANKAPKATWGLDFAEPVICLVPTGTARGSPAVPGSREQQQRKQMGLSVGGEAWGQLWGQENQRASKDAGEMVGRPPPAREECKGRRRLGEGRTRQEGVVEGQGQMQRDRGTRRQGKLSQNGGKRIPGLAASTWVRFGQMKLPGEKTVSRVFRSISTEF